MGSTGPKHPLEHHLPKNPFCRHGYDLSYEHCHICLAETIQQHEVKSVMTPKNNVIDETSYMPTDSNAVVIAKLLNDGFRHLGVHCTVRWLNEKELQITAHHNIGSHDVKHLDTWCLRQPSDVRYVLEVVSDWIVNALAEKQGQTKVAQDVYGEALTWQLPDGK